MHVCTMADSVGTNLAGVSQDQQTCKLHHICSQYEHNPQMEKADLKGGEAGCLPSLLCGLHLDPK